MHCTLCNCRLFLLTRSDHVLYWHPQTPEDGLLFCFSSHISLIHKHHNHQMCVAGHNFRTYLLFVFPIDLNEDVTSYTVPIETPASWSMQQSILFQSHLDLFLLPYWCSTFCTCHRAWLDVNCLISPVWKHLHVFRFSFNLSPVCI